MINDLDATRAGLSQALALHHGKAFTLTVEGQNFLAGSQVYVGASALPTTYVRDSVLTALVSKSVLRTRGNHAVTVVNPGGETSNAINLMVAQRGDVNGNGQITMGDALRTALTVSGLVRPPLPQELGDFNLNGTANIGDALALALFAAGVNPNRPVPQVTSVSPLPVNPGTELTIRGSGFAGTNVDNEVLFTTSAGMTRKTPTSSSIDSLIVMVPLDAISGEMQVSRLDAPGGQCDISSPGVRFLQAALADQNPARLQRLAGKHGDTDRSGFRPCSHVEHGIVYCFGR